MTNGVVEPKPFVSWRLTIFGYHINTWWASLICSYRSVINHNLHNLYIAILTVHCKSNVRVPTICANCCYCLIFDILHKNETQMYRGWYFKNSLHYRKLFHAIEYISFCYQNRLLEKLVV
jgi:hypothetical protein